MSADDFLGLQGKTLLITGATSGIGKATAVLASRHGARVALVSRNRDSLESVASTLSGEGHVVAPFDLADADAIPAMVRKVSDEIGGLDGLVHSAGLHNTLPLRSIIAADVQQLFDANVTSAFMLAKGFRHKQVRKEGASIVFLASAVGLVGQSGVSIYSATKGAIVTLTKSLSLELAREGIRVNCVCPGVVETAMTVGLRKTIGDENFGRVSDAHPLGIGSATDVANAILFLTSVASRWTTGSALVVDGGYTAQ